MRILPLLVLALFPFAAFAHGDSPSLEAEVGGYLIDVGYDDLRAGAPVTFDLDLYTADPIAYADFARVDVRVTRDGAEIAAGAVENEKARVPTYAVTFPGPGGYDIDVRYLDAADALIVARTFHVEVPAGGTVMLRDAQNALRYAVATGLFALSFGIAGYSLWRRYGAKK